MIVHRQQPHPAATALQAALAATGGAISQDQVALAACIFDQPLRAHDPGPAEAQDWWGYRQDQMIYPASVMKLFVLAALPAFRDKGGLGDWSPEDERAAAAMIRISSNEATAYLMGRLTGAEDGPCLGPQALRAWCQRRALLQDWYLAQGRPAYSGLSLLHATYEDSPYGCAFQARDGKNANRLSAMASACLLQDIARGAMTGSDWMMQLLQRDFQRVGDSADIEGDQVRGFLAAGLPLDTKVWSKAGHTSGTRHDLVYAEPAEGGAYILSVMTEGRWSSRSETFLPEFARAFHAQWLARTT